LKVSCYTSRVPPDRNHDQFPAIWGAEQQSSGRKRDENLKRPANRQILRKVRAGRKRRNSEETGKYLFVVGQ